MPNYCVVPMFWGPTFPNGANDPNFPATPYVPDEFQKALASIVDYGYFAALAEYGAGEVVITQAFPFPDPWPNQGNGFYNVIFTVDDVIKFIEKHLDALGGLTDPVPIWGVVIPNGSLLDVHSLGAHSVFPYQGQNHIWFWIYGGSSVGGVCQTATHEIVEAIGLASGAPKELCDDCKVAFPSGATTLNGLTVETYFDAARNTCIAPGTGWVLLDSNGDSVGIVADGASLYQMHRDGGIWRYTGSPQWQLLDDNGDTMKIAASGGNVYQIHKTGKIWKYAGTPQWQLLDSNGDSVDIVADGPYLYQMHKTGKIWKYVGTPQWQLLDDNGDTMKIAASGGNLYQIHKTGKIWKYVGSPQWQLLDSNGDSVDIVADGAILYQMHRDGGIWIYAGSPQWVLLDNNGDTMKIAASNDKLYQIHKTGKIWKYVGSPQWLLCDQNPDSMDIAAGTSKVYQIHRTGKIWSFPT